MAGAASGGASFGATARDAGAFVGRGSDGEETDWPFSEISDAASHTTSVASMPHATTRRRLIAPLDTLGVYARPDYAPRESRVGAVNRQKLWRRRRSERVV